MKTLGSIKQIIGPVVDVEFADALPEINTALTVKEGRREIVLEVAQHLGAGLVRAVALGDTQGLSRGLTVENTGAPVRVPVGRATLGRMFNVLGQPIDGLGALDAEKLKLAPIHNLAPALENQSTQIEIFETGIKVID